MFPGRTRVVNGDTTYAEGFTGGSLGTTPYEYALMAN
eukprot:gene10928-14243_t